MQRDNYINHELLPPSAALIFDDGEILWGKGIGVIKSVVAELCFNTSQTGYQETLTDPSYAKQIITFTFPHIGIVGTNDQDLESKRIYAEGCVINQSIEEYSNWRAQNSLDFFLKKNNVPGIRGVDTRYLTTKLRSQGSLKGCIVPDAKRLDEAKLILNQFSGLGGVDLAKEVSTVQKYLWSEGTHRLIMHNLQNVTSCGSLFIISGCVLEDVTTTESFTITTRFNKI